MSQMSQNQVKIFVFLKRTSQPESSNSGEDASSYPADEREASSSQSTSSFPADTKPQKDFDPSGCQRGNTPPGSRLVRLGDKINQNV